MNPILPKEKNLYKLKTKIGNIDIEMIEMTVSTCWDHGDLKKIFYDSLHFPNFFLVINMHYFHNQKKHTIQPLPSYTKTSSSSDTTVKSILSVMVA